MTYLWVSLAIYGVFAIIFAPLILLAEYRLEPVLKNYRLDNFDIFMSYMCASIPLVLFSILLHVLLHDKIKPLRLSEVWNKCGDKISLGKRRVK